MIGCTRMYNLNPAVARIWEILLFRAAGMAGISLEVIAYPAPAPLPELWRRPDMGCVFMCGWPFRQSDPRPQIVAAPIPVAGPCSGPRYCTDMVVDATRPWTRIEETFGGRIAWTDEGSHSGFNAPRHLLSGMRGGKARLYSEAVGPLITPRASLESVLSGRADVAPLDSYFHQLLARHEPGTAGRLRVVARTECAPIPPLVASATADRGAVAALGAALVEFSDAPANAPLLEELCLAGFASVPDPEVYSLAEAWDRAAHRAGYPFPA